MDLATLVHEAESAVLPSGDAERFAGYGVMGPPFASGHVLAMRRFPASSIGPGYSSVWHRTPSGVWTFWQDQAADQGCARYFSEAVSTVTETETDELRVRVPASDLDRRSTMVATPRSKVFNALGSVLPDRAWRSSRLISAMGPIAGRMLGVGGIRMAGHVPNGQSFVANPQRFTIPQQGVFAVGRAVFRPRG